MPIKLQEIKPLKIEEATLSLTQPSCARVCVEMDLLKDRIKSIKIVLEDRDWKQRIMCKHIFSYYNYCKKIGNVDRCFHVKKREIHP